MRKPFDLQKAIAGEPIVTRDGTAVKFIAYVPEMAGHQKLIVLVKNLVQYFSDDGSYYCSGDETSGKDLFMESQTETVWVNLWLEGNDINDNHRIITGGYQYATEEQAKASVGAVGYLGSVAVEVPKSKVKIYQKR